MDQYANIAVSTQKVRALPHLRADTAMYDLLKLFQSGRTHMVSGHQAPSIGQMHEASGNAISCIVMLDLSYWGCALHALVQGQLGLVCSNAKAVTAYALCLTSLTGSKLLAGKPRQISLAYARQNSLLHVVSPCVRHILLCRWCSPAPPKSRLLPWLLPRLQRPSGMVQTPQT